MRRLVLATVVCVCAVAADASAQMVQRPARPYRGLFGGGPTTDPNRTRSELTFTGSVLVGHDTWLSPGRRSGGIDRDDRAPERSARSTVKRRSATTAAARSAR